MDDRIGRGNRRPKRSATWTLLIVDDERAVRGLVKATLERDEYGGFEAADGDEPLALA
jgi:DNA-binding response OmpR family regulator